jgi:hypothetical protein
MVEAGSGAIFRIATAGETEADAKTAGEIIEFNGGTDPDATCKMIATGFEMTRDISPHPNPKRALTIWQDNLLGTMEVIVTGYFKDHDATAGPGQFFNWMKEPTKNASLPFGQFGLRLDDFGQNALDLTPSAVAGYFLHRVSVQDVESPRDQVTFIARLIRNGTI